MTPPSAQLAPAITPRGPSAAARMDPQEELNSAELSRILLKLNKSYGFHTHSKQPRPKGSGTRSSGPVISPWIRKLDALLGFSSKEVDDSFLQLNQAVKKRGMPRDRKPSPDVRVELEKVYESILDEKLAEFQDRDESVVGLFGIGSGDHPKEEPNTWRSDERYEAQKVAQDLATLNLGPSRSGEDIVFKGRGKNRCGNVISMESLAPSGGRTDLKAVQSTPHQGPSQRQRRRKDLSLTEVLPGEGQRSPERPRNRDNRHQLEKLEKRHRSEQAQHGYGMEAEDGQEAQRRGWERSEGEDHPRLQTRKEERDRRSSRTRAPLPPPLPREDLGDPYQEVREQSRRRRGRQPEGPPPTAQRPARPVVVYEDDGTEPDSDGTFYSASSSVAEPKSKDKAAFTEPEGEYAISNFRVSSSKDHQKRPILLGQERVKDIRVPVKPVHRNGPGSYGEPFQRSFGSVGSSSAPSSFASTVFTRSITAGGFSSPKNGTFATDITEYDSFHDGKPKPVSYYSDTDRYDSQGQETDNATDVDEPEEDARFYPREKSIRRPQAPPPRRKQKSAAPREAESFQRTPLSPVPQSVVASETSEWEERQKAELMVFFDEKPLGPELLQTAEDTGDVHWDFAAQQEAEQSPDGMSDRGGSWVGALPPVVPGAPQRSSPGLSEEGREEGKVDEEGGGGISDEEDLEFGVGADFEAEMLSKFSLRGWPSAYVICCHSTICILLTNVFVEASFRLNRKHSAKGG